MTPEQYRDRLTETLPAIMKFISNTCQYGRCPSEDDFHAAIDIGYKSMLQNPDVKMAGAAVRTYINNIVKG